MAPSPPRVSFSRRNQGEPEAEDCSPCPFRWDFPGLATILSKNLLLLDLLCHLPSFDRRSHSPTAPTVPPWPRPSRQTVARSPARELRVAAALCPSFDTVVGLSTVLSTICTSTRDGQLSLVMLPSHSPANPVGDQASMISLPRLPPISSLLAGLGKLGSSLRLLWWFALGGKHFASASG